MTSFIRIIKFAFQDIARNLGLSFMTVFILLLMLLSINILWSVQVVTKEAAGLIKNQVNVSFYLVSGVTDRNITDLKNFIGSFQEVTNIQTQSRQQVLESFQKRHQMSQEVLDALKELGGNPFGPTLIVTARQPEDYKKIIDALDVPEYRPLIESKSFDGHEEAITTIQNITNRVENVGLGLSLIFAIISFMIIFNTIRVAIYTQRTEISIKRLVGANNWFIRGPYLIESAIFTLVSTILAGLIIFKSFALIDPYLSVVFPTGFSLTNYYHSHILTLILVQGGAVLFLTVLSSGLAMQKHLKV
jgi:cell division transport system permease protein